MFWSNEGQNEVVVINRSWWNATNLLDVHVWNSAPSIGSRFFVFNLSRGGGGGTQLFRYLTKWSTSNHTNSRFYRTCKFVRLCGLAFHVPSEPGFFSQFNFLHPQLFVWPNCATSTPLRPHIFPLPATMCHSLSIAIHSRMSHKRTKLMCLL